MVDGGKVLFSQAQWQAITTAGSSIYSPALATAVVVELVVLSWLIVFSVSLIDLYFRKRRSFPPLYCVLLISSAGFFLIDNIVVANVLTESQAAPGDSVRAVRNVIMAGIWVVYLRVSKRVAATFVH